MLSKELRNRVDRIWDKIWASGISNPLSAIEYFSTVLLLRRLAQPEEASLQKSEANTKLVSQVLEAVKQEDASTIARLMAELQTKYGLGASPEIAAVSTWREIGTLKEVIKEVWNLELTDRNHDILGDLFEYLLGHLSTAGHFGQFRTPRHLIKFIVEAVSPRPDETILDPACGTGGFLIAAREYIGSDESCNYIGDEVDSTMARIARTNMILHAAHQQTIIRNDDSLLTVEQDADVILANPPFAGAVHPERAAGFECDSRKTELLFIELMIRRLRAKGRAGVIIPTSVLTARTKSAKWIRRQLLEKNHLQAVVELPNGIFRPYTDVKTAILFWTNDTPAVSILMIRVDQDGYSLDDRRQTIDNSDLPLALEMIQGKDAAIPSACVSMEEICSQDYNLLPSRYIVGGPPEQDSLENRSVSESIVAARQAILDLSRKLQRLEKLVK